MSPTPLLVVSPEDRRTCRAVRYSLLLARAGADIEAAQRLRYRVLTAEPGAELPARDDGREVDRFDLSCEQLIVRNEDTGQVVAAYRLLPPRRAAAAGGLHAETRFDLAGLRRLRPTLLELSGVCIDPEHRNGAVIGLVWAGAVRYCVGHRLTHLAGCAPLSLADGGERAAAMWELARAKHLSPASLRVRPLHPWVPTSTAAGPVPPPPPLLRGYLRLGAWVCGPPAHDAALGIAELPMLLDVARLQPRQRRFFLRT
jgi:putative hemolysin